MSAGPTPELSVIVPIEDTRGQEEAAIRSLASEQTLDRDRYEVIVPMPGEDPDAERRVSGLLDPARDRAIQPGDAGLNRYALMNLGAELARGQRFFFIEAHCVADSDCLEQLLEFLGSNGYVGASCASISRAGSALGEYEEELFGQSLRWLPQRDHWYKTLIHGFAVERDAFEAVGGFEPRFGNFSDIALSAAFDVGGYRLGYAPEATVRHFYDGDLRGTFAYIRDELAGEIEYRASIPGDPCDSLHAGRVRVEDQGDRSGNRSPPAQRRSAGGTLLEGAAGGSVSPCSARASAATAGPRLAGASEPGERGWRWGHGGPSCRSGLGLRRPSQSAYLAWWDAATHFCRLDHLSPKGIAPEALARFRRPDSTWAARKTARSPASAWWRSTRAVPSAGAGGPRRWSWSSSRGAHRVSFGPGAARRRLRARSPSRRFSTGARSRPPPSARSRTGLRSRSDRTCSTGRVPPTP